MPPPGEHNDVNEKPKAPTPGSKLDQNTAELFRAELRTPGHEKSPSLEKSPAEKTPRGENGLPKPPKSDAAVKSDDPKSLIFDNKIFAGGSGTLTTEKLAGLAADRFKAPAGDTLTVPPIARPETLLPSQKPNEGDTKQQQTPEQKMLDPNVTAEQKIAIADQMYHNGQKSFKDAEGHTYQINESTVGGRKLVGVFTADEHGHSQVSLRGIVEKDGHVSKQQDAKGHQVDFESKWANKHEGGGLSHQQLDKSDGSNVVRKPDGHGGTIENHSGSKPEQNYTKTDDGKGTTEIRHPDGTSVKRTEEPGGKYNEIHSGPKPEDTYTVSGDQNNRVETHSDGKGGTKEIHTSTDPKNNFTKETLADHSTIVTDAKGSTTTSADGNTITFQGKDGTGSVRQKEDSGKFTETHTGPNAADKYTVTGDGKGYTKEVHPTDADQSKTFTKETFPDNHTVVTDTAGKTTTSPDGKTITFEGTNHTGFERKIAADGTSTEKHTGPTAADSFTVKDDGKGTRVESRDDGNGGTSEKYSFQNKPEQNYTLQTHADHSTDKTDAAGNKTNTSADGKTTTYSGVDGTSYTRKTNDDHSFVEQHTGPQPSDKFVVQGNGKGDNVETHVDGKNKLEIHTSKDDPSQNYRKSFHANGSVTIADANGSCTTSGDGKNTKFSGADGRTIERQRGENGSYTETHTGSGQNDNYTVTDNGKGLQVTTSKDANGNTIEKHEDNNDTKNNYTKEIHPDKTSVITDAKGQKTSYDADGKKIETPTETDKKQHQVEELKKPSEVQQPKENFTPETALTTEKFVEVGKQVLQKIHPDGGPVTKDELSAALQNPEFKGEQAQALAAMYKGFDKMHNLDNHEWFFNSKSLTAGDLDKYGTVANDRDQAVQKDWGDKWWADNNLKKYADSQGVLHSSDIQKALKDTTISADDRTHLESLQKFANEKGTGTDKAITKKDIDDRAQDVWNGSDNAKMCSDVQNALQRTTKSHNDAQGEKQLYDTPNPLDSIKPDAVKQGTIGDCYFEATIAAVAANHPEIIRDMIHDNKDGTYTVTFPGDKDNPITVKAPTEAEQGLYNGGTKNGTWASVLEKAYGQHEYNKNWFHGGQNLHEVIGHGGPMAPAMKLLMGKDAQQTYFNENLNQGQLRDQLTDAFSAHPPKAVTAISICEEGGSDKTNTTDGYAKNHAYTILGFTPDGHGGGMVKVRNPWGNDETGPGGVSEIPLDKFSKNFRYLYKSE